MVIGRDQSSDISAQSATSEAGSLPRRSPTREHPTTEFGGKRSGHDIKAGFSRPLAAIHGQAGDEALGESRSTRESAPSSSVGWGEFGARARRGQTRALPAGDRGRQCRRGLFVRDSLGKLKADERVAPIANKFCLLLL